MTSRSVVYAISQVVRLRSLANRDAYFWERRSGHGGGSGASDTAAVSGGHVEEVSGDAGAPPVLHVASPPPPGEPAARCDACGCSAPHLLPRPAAALPAAACGYMLRCQPCGCACCERCLWRVLCDPPDGEWEERGQLRCARCRLAIVSPGQPDDTEALDELRRIVRLGSCAESKGLSGGEAGDMEAGGGEAGDKEAGVGEAGDEEAGVGEAGGEEAGVGEAESMEAWGEGGEAGDRGAEAGVRGGEQEQAGAEWPVQAGNGSSNAGGGSVLAGRTDRGDALPIGGRDGGRSGVVHSPAVCQPSGCEQPGEGWHAQAEGEGAPHLVPEAKERGEEELSTVRGGGTGFKAGTGACGIDAGGEAGEARTAFVRPGVAPGQRESDVCGGQGTQGQECTHGGDSARDEGGLAPHAKTKVNRRSMRWCVWCLYENFRVRAHCLVCNLAPGARQGKVRPAFVAVPPIASACAAVARLTVEQRRDAVHQAAARSDTARLTALHAAGAPLDLPNEYGFTPLHEAAWHGAAAAVRRLGALGVDPRPDRAHGGGTPATAAAANGHSATLAALEWIGADLDSFGSEEGMVPLGYLLRRTVAPLLEPGPATLPAADWTAWLARRVLQVVKVADGDHVAGGAQPSDAHGPCRDTEPLLSAPLPACAVTTEVSGAPPLTVSPAMRWLIEPDEAHAGAGSVIIDGAFSEAMLSRLDRLFAQLPLAPRYKCTQGLSDRAYFCDAEGWVRHALAAAVAAGTPARGAPVQGVAMPHMRFLLYAEAGGGLPPHVDLSRTDGEGARTALGSPARDAPPFSLCARAPFGPA